MTKTYDALPKDQKEAVNKIVDATMGLIRDSEDKVNVAILKAVLEQLNEQKISLKAQIKADADAAAKAARDEATRLGRELNVEVGDEVTFVMGSGKLARQFTRPVQKVGDQTVTVEFTPEYPTLAGEAGKRYIQYRKLVSVKKADGTVIAVEAAA
jgi:hypothetical protein